MLGFGTARLPVLDDNVDEEKTIEMLRCAVDNGVNYLDLGYSYDLSQQERVNRIIGRALGEEDKKKIKITAVIPHHIIGSPDDFDGYLEKQLEWLGTGNIDFLLLGGLNRDTWPRLQGMNILARAERAVAGGLIGGVGFAFHDHFMTLREIIDAWDGWELAQFQYSYMDVDHHPGTGGLRYAADKGLAVVVTEPLKGGRLIQEPPETVAEVWAQTPPGRTLAGWGLDWLWSHPEITTVVSDMSAPEQVQENVALVDAAAPDSFSVSEQILIGGVRDAYRARRVLLCTACRGCVPCPVGIDVPRIFEIYNDAVMYDDAGTGRRLYRDEGHDINLCNECGACAAACGFKFDIPDWLKKARELLD